MPKSRAIRRFKETGKKKAPVLSPKELKRLLYVAGETRNPERNQLIVWMLFAAGFRITEIAQIEVQDVISPSGKVKSEVIIPAKYSKSGRAGRVYFYHSKLIKALDHYLAFRVSNRLMMNPVESTEYLGLKKDSKLILSENRRPYSLKRKTRTKKDGRVVDHWACDTLQAMVTTWGREAGVEGFATHSGRRTFGTRLARQGASEKHLCLLLRHHTEDMPYEYIDPDHLAIKKTLSSIHSWPDSEL